MDSKFNEILKTAETRLEMIWSEKRLATFKTWPFPDNAPCSKEKLAEAGFFFTGSNREPDAVQCFLCDKAMDGWEEDDDPWVEHLNHSKTCTFAKLGQPEEALSFHQLLEIHTELCEKQFEKGTANMQDTANKLFSTRSTKLKRRMQTAKK